MLGEGKSVSTDKVLQLRNWAVHPDDVVLSIEEIARRILREEGNPND
jgi:hypothetical protein